MNQHVSVITLSSSNIPRARKFYERLGWKPAHHDDEVANRSWRKTPDNPC
jgi:catechol 2,3-dioxygenase-like lactoylglutathione lyase family enzyme